MAEITAAMVKELREKTGAGMMDCKKALTAAEGDMEGAIEHLRKTGIAKQEKKSGRATTEGKVATYINDGIAAQVEVLCETDFAAKNDKFVSYCDGLAERVATECTAVGDLSESVAEGEKDRIGELVTNIGENIQVRRVLRWDLEGQAGSYLHMGGKIGVLVDVKGDADEDYLNNLCMHIAAFNPRYVRPDDVPAESVEKEKEIAAAQPDLANKPANILDKILIGKINKWYKDVCLTEQPWVRDDKISVQKANPKAEIVRFARWEVGEEL